MQCNIYDKPRTHNGATASRVSHLEQLRRAVLSCMLFEDTFYESGEDIAQRIKKLCALCPHDIIPTATDAKAMGIRHAPLLLAVEACRHASRLSGVDRFISEMITRADDLTEFCAIFAKSNGQSFTGLKLSSAAKRGLARAFGKFDEYQLAKYNRKTPIRLADVLRLCHPKPMSDDQSELWKRLSKGTLATPNTWETRLSSGEDKAKVFTDLLQSGRLGTLALLRNLRTIIEAGIDHGLICRAIRDGDYSRMFPHQIATAIKAVDSLPYRPSAVLDCLCRMFQQCASVHTEGITGKTTVLIDVSVSMSEKLSGRSEVRLVDAAIALATCFRYTPMHDVEYFTFSNKLVHCQYSDDLLAQWDKIDNSQVHYGTALAAAMRELNKRTTHHDRLIVITDEQSDPGYIPAPAFDKAYIINVAPYQNGVEYGKYLHINGFSASVLKYIREIEHYDY